MGAKATLMAEPLVPLECSNGAYDVLWLLAVNPGGFATIGWFLGSFLQAAARMVSKQAT
jgi:hypothetical protein